MFPDLPKFATYLLDLLLWIPRKIFELLTDGVSAVLTTVFSWFDVSFFASISADLSALPAGILWFLAWFKFAYGLKVIFAALSLRFLIRRIPFFG